MGTNSPIIIRDIGPADIPALAALSAATFAGTFQSLYSPQNLSWFLGEYHSEAYYRKALKNPSVRLLAADKDGALVGYAKVGPNTLPCDPPWPHALELSRIYVSSKARSEGIGEKLIQSVIDHAVETGKTSIVLGVFSENFAGHRFYHRHGFQKIGEYDFPVGDHRDHEWIMQLKL